MELALLGALAGVGWTLSAKGVARRTQNTPNIEMEGTDYPFEQDTDHTTRLRSDTARIGRHVKKSQQKINYWKDPAAFMTSDKTASVDTQRKVDLFTGADSVQWKKKAEITNIWNPEDTKTQVTSGGKSMNTDLSYDPEDIAQRNVFSTQMNNHLPFTQERVGPGLGVDPDVPSADGLHSQFRVLPTHTLNAHRTNQLAGRSTSGAALVTSGGRRYDTFHQKVPSLVNHEPNIGPGRSTSFNAQSVFPVPEHKPTKSQNLPSTEAFTAAYTPRGIQTRPDCHVQKEAKQLDELPVRGHQRQDLTAPTETRTEYDRMSLPQDREKKTPYVTGKSAAMTGYQTYDDTGVRKGMKVHRKKCDALPWTMEQTGSTGASSSIARGTIQDGLYIMKGTSRSNETPYMPGMQSLNDMQTVRPEMHTSTQKEVSTWNHTSASGGYSYLHAQDRRPKFRKSRGRETENTVSHAGLLGGVANCDIGRVKRKHDRKNAYRSEHIGHAPYAIQRESQGVQKSSRKIRSENPRGQYDSLGLGLICSE